MEDVAERHGSVPDAGSAGFWSAGRPVRPVPGLFDLAVAPAADGGVALVGRPDRSLTGAELADVVRARGGDGQDVRVPVVADDDNLPTLRAMARELGRDVLAAPAGSELRPVPTLGGAAHPTDAVDLVPVDLATGDPVDWTLIGPSEQAAGPGWFELSSGMVLTRTGAVRLALPGGGLAVATRDDFVPRRAAAAKLRAGHPRLLTLAVGTRAGDFVVGDYTGRVLLCDGQALAAVLADLPLYGCDVRVWLSWPESHVERRRLRRNLYDLAEMTGASVWAPAEGARVEILDGCRDLAVLRSRGEPGLWEQYYDGSGADFASDPDGRLAPAGGAVTRAYPGVPLVSVARSREGEVADRYTRMPAARDAFRVDLAVLGDGRLALRYHDDSLLAVGSRQLGALLRRAGWRGGPVAVLSDVAPERIAGARRHLAHLARELACPVTLEAAPDGARAAPRQSHAASGSAQPTTVSALPRTVGPEPSRAVGPEPSRAVRAAPPLTVEVDPHIGPEGPSASHRDAARAGEAAAPATVTPDRPPDAVASPPAAPSRFIDGPRLGPAARKDTWHGVAWLPAQPQVNEEACDLYVECHVDPDRVARDGLPTPHLFVAAHLDRDRLAARTLSAFLLRLHVGPGAAVDVAASEAEPPEAAAALLEDADVYLLPAGWLNRCRLVTAYRVDRRGQLAGERRYADAAVTIDSQGAAHGVPGLPDDVVRWPHGPMRSTATRFVTVPRAGLGSWRPLHRRRPPVQPGHTLLEIRVGRAQAIDVTATHEALRPLPSVRTILPRLSAENVEHLLPATAYPSVTVDAEYHAEPDGWRRARLGGRPTLASWTPADQVVIS